MEAEDLDIHEIVSSELQNISVEGYLEHDIELVRVILDESMSLSFGLQYSSDPDIYSRWFGEGWKVPLIESVEYELSKDLTFVSFPWGSSTKLLHGQSGTYRSVDERWQGKRSGKTLEISSKSGLTLIYKSGRLTNLRTIGGKTVSWHYRHPVIQIVEGRNNVLFSYKHDRNGSILKAENVGEVFDLLLNSKGRLEKIDQSGEEAYSFKYGSSISYGSIPKRYKPFLKKKDVKTARYNYFAYSGSEVDVFFIYNYETRHPVVGSIGEDLISYEIEYSRGKNIEAKLDVSKMTVGKPQVAYSYNRSKGIYSYSYGETTLRDTYFMTPGPLFMKLRRSENKVGGSDYEPTRALSYYPDGKLKRAVNYPDQILIYSYNENGSLEEVTDGDKIVAKWNYDHGGSCYKEYYVLKNGTSVELMLAEGQSPNLIITDPSGKEYKSTLAQNALKATRATYMERFNQN